MTPDAAIAGRPASLQDAIAAAATLIGGAKRVLVGGLDADAAGIEAAILLARRCRGSVDHIHSAAALRDLRVLRESGAILTTALQARALADVVLLAGLDPAASGLDARLWLDRAPSLHPERSRIVLRLPAERFGLLRAAVAGRKLAFPDDILHAADALLQAKYAVVVWSATLLDTTRIETLCGLVEDLNRTTRAAGLPLPPPDGAALAMQVAAYTTGLPLPLGFDAGTGEPTHDPWLHAADRVAAEGAIDAAIWLSAGRARPIPWPARIPVLALAPGEHGAPPASPAANAAAIAIAIAVGIPGIDHDGVLFDEDSAALVHRRATRPAAGLPSAAEVLHRLAAALPAC